MDISQIRTESTFQLAVAAVELLSLEDQAMLIEIFQTRLEQQKLSELEQEVAEVHHKYAESNFEFSSIDDFLAELEL